MVVIRFCSLSAGIGLICAILGMSLGSGRSLSMQIADIKEVPWPCFRRDVHNTGRSDWRAPASLKSWVYETIPPPGGEAKIFATPVLGPDGTLYQGASHLYALDATTGDKKWQTSTGDALFTGSPAIGGGGTLYIGCDDTYVYSLNMKNGDMQWKAKTGAAVRSSPALSADGTLYVGSDDRSLYAFDVHNGSKRWTFTATHGVASSPVIGEKGLIYCQNWGTLYAINAKTGTQAWKYQVPDDLYSKSTPAIGYNGNLYAAFVLKGETKDNRGTVIALDATSGTFRWQRELPAYIYASPAVGTGGLLYIGCGDGKLYALDEKSGEIRWTFTTGSRIQGSPAIGADGTVYLGAYDKRIYAVNGATGARKWDFMLGGAVQASLVVSQDGTVFAGALDGKVYAVRMKE